jgi:hypothetical protein
MRSHKKVNTRVWAIFLSFCALCGYSLKYCHISTTLDILLPIALRESSQTTEWRYADEQFR